MPSRTQIANMALAKVGASSRLTNLDTDASSLADTCRLYFDAELDSILRMYPWNCANARKEYIAADAEELGSVNEYRYRYTLPTNPWCLRPLTLYDQDDVKIGFRIEGRKLLSNERPVNLKYTKRLTDANQTEFEPLLVKVMVYSFAMEIAPAINLNKKLSADMAVFLKDIWWPMARNANGQEGYEELTEAMTLHRLIDYDEYV